MGKLKKSGLFGKADPYVAVTYGSHKTKSSVIKNNLNPEWNFVNLLTINEKASDEVLLEVYDKDTGSKDDFMGRVSLPISELATLKQGQWIPLQKTKSGEICLLCDFVTELETSEASGDRDAFERVESVEELETATLTDVKTKKAGGIRAVKELLSAEKKPDYEFDIEHAESSPRGADTPQTEPEVRAEGVKEELHLSVEAASETENAKLEEESKQKAEAEEAKAKQEEEARLKSEADAAKAKEEEEARLKVEAEKEKQENESRLKAEAEAAKAKEEEEARLKAETEKAKQEEEARIKVEAEKAKQEEEEEAR